ncbi:hypothetical protein ACJ72_00821 [Emergomyces africanus]|uniref:Uncharacterized protein n=1 Tax=Emergomyces africanus TaxID=1955775 RepID=A0A1B7P735_9EURO|nr:hypothetical protein ACJ72_00821 [Emergomyces africanus]
MDLFIVGFQASVAMPGMLSSTANNQHAVQTRIREYYLLSRQQASVPTINDCRELLLDLINIYPKTTLILDALGIKILTGPSYVANALLEAISAHHECNQIPILRLLIRAGADVNARDPVRTVQQALVAAIFWRQKEIIQLLLDAGADVNAPLLVGTASSALASVVHGNSLASAVHGNSMGLVKLLIEYGTKN